MLNDPLAASLSKIQNYEKIGKKECMITPASKMIQTVLALLQSEHYLGTAEEVSDARGGVLRVNLLGSINKCGVIKPRFSVDSKGYEKFEKRYLPASHAGIIIVSTSKGLMTHNQAKQEGIGGRLIAYCY
jgi:small subunit ribosomal protein S8